MCVHSLSILSGSMVCKFNAFKILRAKVGGNRAIHSNAWFILFTFRLQEELFRKVLCEQVSLKY